MLTRLDGKIILVTGASSGIGRATALACAEAGAAAVVVADVSVTGGEETVRLLHERDTDAIFVRTDVANPDDVMATIDAVIEAYGRIDGAFNNAGIEGTVASTAECTLENWDRVLAINLTGVWLCMKHELQYMQRQGHGSIVNCASIAGLVGFRGSPAYVASKHGIVGLTKTAALEYAGDGIRVNAVCPGVIQTPMIDRAAAANPSMVQEIAAAIPVGRVGVPDEIASAVVWLLSDGSSFTTGQTITVDGGWVAQ